MVITHIKRIECTPFQGAGSHLNKYIKFLILFMGFGGSIGAFSLTFLLLVSMMSLCMPVFTPRT